MTIADDIRERLTRIAREDAAFRAFIRVDQDEALSAAKASDQRRQDGSTLGPLDGVAVAVKDNLAIVGKDWTAGIAGRRDVIARDDSAAVTKLRKAGAVLIGGANMEEAALGAVTDNPTFGRCINPLGAGLTPGGSSGGSAAAVTAGFVDLALGTDTMGSVRVPAAYCGISGIKPTFGAVDRDGLVLLCPSLDTIGPMAQDVRLLWPALQALASDEAKIHWKTAPRNTGLAGLTVGMPKQLQLVDCETAILAGLEQSIQAVIRLGATVQDIDLVGWDPHRARRAGLLIIEAEGAQELADLIEDPGTISDHLRSMLIYGRDAPPEKISKARAEIETAANATTRAFTDVDMILMPTAPQRAFPHGSQVPANQADLTALANFAGCPAVSIPVNVPGQALPGSVQLIGPKWSEPGLLGQATILSEELQARQ